MSAGANDRPAETVIGGTRAGLPDDSGTVPSDIPPQEDDAVRIPLASPRRATG